MSKLMRNALILAKIETVYGTDSVPTGAANAILCKGIAPQPIVAEFADRGLVRPYFGASEQLPVSAYSEIEFEVELAGSGAAGTAPKWGPLLRACGFSETITAATDVKYAPVTSGGESLSLYYYLDGLLYKMTGCRGDVSFSMSAKGIPMMKYKFTGMYNAGTDTAMATGVDYSGFKTPLAVTTLNTPTWALHGYTGNLSSLDMAMANAVSYRELVGSASVVHTDRKPSGSAVFELGTVAAKDWNAIILAGTASTLTITHGTVAGNIIKFDAPKVQLSSPSFTDDNGVAMLNVSLSLVPNVGNDEIVVTVK